MDSKTTQTIIVVAGKVVSTLVLGVRRSNFKTYIGVENETILCQSCRCKCGWNDVRCTESTNL